MSAMWSAASGGMTTNGTATISLHTGTPPASFGVHTRAVETKDGWVGQVVVDGEIVWESMRWEMQSDARHAADDRVLRKIKRMFA